MTALERVEQASSALKVFPLPSVALFPNLVVPLHIFEPRYRELLRDALASDQLFAMGQLAPGWEGDYEGRPPLKPVVCVGTIAWHEAQADGRFDLLLQGVVRARVKDELPAGKPYREFSVELLADAPYSGPEEEALRRAVLELSGDLPGPVAEGLLQLAARSRGGALADVVAGSIVQESDRREALLCELDVRQRLLGTISEVGSLIARMAPSRPPGLLH